LFLDAEGENVLVHDRGYRAYAMARRLFRPRKLTVLPKRDVIF
jgi:hypothetical protein